jgi:hypothetical protein
MYKENIAVKFLLSILIFISSYINTLEWDLLFLKRKLVKVLNINKNGVIFNVNKDI